MSQIVPTVFAQSCVSPVILFLDPLDNSRIKTAILTGPLTSSLSAASRAVAVMIDQEAARLIVAPASLLLLLLIIAPHPAATAGSDFFYLPVEHHGARWEWLDLWTKLLQIRRQFDRDGFPRQGGSIAPSDGGARHGEM